MDYKLKDKKALITGSTAGIGFATAKLLLQEGAEVIINGRSKARIDETITKLQQLVPSAKVSGIAADFSKVEEVNALTAQLPEVDILINNVSIFEPKPFLDIPDEDWLRLFEINVMSGVRLSRHYVKPMLAKNWGRVIFISSESSIDTPADMVHYGMTKTAQLSLNRGVALLTKGTNVTSNAVLPGPTASEGVGVFVQELAKEKGISAAEMEKDFFKEARPGSLLQRFATVEEIANLIVYVASPLSSATNGAALRADGGLIKNIY